jgi:hypothetical protein
MENISEVVVLSLEEYLENSLPDGSLLVFMFLFLEEIFPIFLSVGPCFWIYYGICSFLE